MQDLFGNLASQILGRRGGPHDPYAANTRGDSWFRPPGVAGGFPSTIRLGQGSPFMGGDPFTGRTFAGMPMGGLQFSGNRGLLERPGPQELPGPALGFAPQGAAPPLPGMPPVDLTAPQDFPQVNPQQQFTPPPRGMVSSGTPPLMIGGPGEVQAPVFQTLNNPPPFLSPWVQQFFGPQLPAKVSI